MMTDNHHNPMTRMRRNLRWLAFGLVATLATQAPCRAGLIISTPSFSDSAGNSGSFEILVTNPDQMSYNVAAFTTQITVDPNSGVTLTGASTPTDPSFVFYGLAYDPLTASGQGSNSIFVYDDTSVDLSSNPPTVPFQVVGPGASYVLAIIDYSISSSAPGGMVALTLDPVAIAGGLSDLSDPGGNSVIGGVESGYLTVTAGNPVPEPSTLVLTAIAAIPFALRAANRGRKRRGS